MSTAPTVHPPAFVRPAATDPRFTCYAAGAWPDPPTVPATPARKARPGPSYLVTLSVDQRVPLVPATCARKA